MGEWAFAWVRRYLEEARPSLALTPDDGTVFLTNLGTPFEAGRLTQLVREHVNAAGTGKSGACHLFRHTMATLMLENGADVRFIQQQLGTPNCPQPRFAPRSRSGCSRESAPARSAATLSPEARAEIDAELAEEADELADGDGSL